MRHVGLVARWMVGDQGVSQVHTVRAVFKEVNFLGNTGGLLGQKIIDCVLYRYDRIVQRGPQESRAVSGGHVLAGIVLSRGIGPLSLG